MSRTRTPARPARTGDAVRVVVVLATLVLGAVGALHVVTGTSSWLRVAVWFAAAIVLHDLVAFPVYAIADRVLTPVTGAGGRDLRRRVPVVNHLWLPALGSLQLLVVYLPSISGQGDGGLTDASGLSAGSSLLRWALTSAVLFALGAVLYAGRLLRAR